MTSITRKGHARRTGRHARHYSARERIARLLPFLAVAAGLAGYVLAVGAHLGAAL